LLLVHELVCDVVAIAAAARGHAGRARRGRGDVGDDAVVRRGGCQGLRAARCPGLVLLLVLHVVAHAPVAVAGGGRGGACRGGGAGKVSTGGALRHQLLAGPAVGRGILVVRERVGGRGGSGFLCGRQDAVGDVGKLAVHRLHQ